MQTVSLNQRAPQALVVKAWSAARDVSGARDDGYSIYMDVHYMDGGHEWSVTLRFEPGTHEWQPARMLLQRSKPIQRIDVHCMLRDHSGTAWFADVIVMASDAFVCACDEDEAVRVGRGTSDVECGPCQAGATCLHGDSFRSAS